MQQQGNCPHNTAIAALLLSTVMNTLYPLLGLLALIWLVYSASYAGNFSDTRGAAISGYFKLTWPAPGMLGLAGLLTKSQGCMDFFSGAFGFLVWGFLYGVVSIVLVGVIAIFKSDADE